MLDSTCRCRSPTWNGSSKRGVHPAGESLGVEEAADVRRKYGELVATEAGHGVGIAHHVAESFGHLDQQRVPSVVAEGVVDLFEPVDVEDHQRKALARTISRGDGSVEAVLQQPPVRQPGQRIVQREVLVLGGLVAQRRAGSVHRAVEQQPCQQRDHGDHRSDGEDSTPDRRLGRLPGDVHLREPVDASESVPVDDRDRHLKGSPG